MTVAIKLVSDSEFIINALERDLSTHFKTIEKLTSPQNFFAKGAVSNCVLIWEVGSTEDCIRQLSDAKKQGLALHNVLLMLRSETQLEALEPIMYDVGAVLQPSLDPNAIARTVHAMSPDLCILPTIYIKRPSRAAALPNASPRLDRLTTRERAVLARLSEGDCDKEIAAAMNISDSTVRVHVRSVIRKLGVQNRIQAALHAVGAQPNPCASYRH
ncbi:helix-turn-helix transcriptional regulator [Paracoccaceae bacterium GXU_MW_L88]